MNAHAHEFPLKAFGCCAEVHGAKIELLQFWQSPVEQANHASMLPTDPLAVMVFCGFNVLADDMNIVPLPFRAEMVVRTTEFSPTAVEARHESLTLVAFSYSNTWWRIDAVTITGETEERVYESCMSIPEGARHIAYPPDRLGWMAKGSLVRRLLVLGEVSIELSAS